MKKLLIIVFWAAVAWAAGTHLLAWKARSDFSGEVSSFMVRERDDSRAGQNARRERGTSKESEILDRAEAHDLDLVLEDIETEGDTVYVTFGQTILWHEFVFTYDF